MLATQIHTSTQTAHSTTLALITARLPLALPPHSPTPATYASGLLHLAPIYALLESLWTDTLSTQPHPLSDILAAIHLPPLLRAHRIRSDILAITGWSAAMYESTLRSVSTGHLADFLAHMSLAILDKPHLIIAYSYLLHMAVFRGGRIIKATLEAAGGSFWAQTPPPLRFFDVDGPGGDLAGEYLSRLEGWEHLLTDQERLEIVEEAHVVYDSLALVIAQLDELCLGTQGDTRTLNPNLPS